MHNTTDNYKSSRTTTPCLCCTGPFLTAWKVYGTAQGLSLLVLGAAGLVEASGAGGASALTDDAGSFVRLFVFVV